MFKRIMMAAVFMAAFAMVAGTPDTADAHRRFRRAWRRPVVVTQPVVVGRAYYPARYYRVGRPFWGPRYYYGPGVHVSVGW